MLQSLEKLALSSSKEFSGKSGNSRSWRANAVQLELLSGANLRNPLALKDLLFSMTSGGQASLIKSS